MYVIIYYHKMENLITLEMIEQNQNILVKTIFTKLQLNILKKRIQKKTLNNNERTYYYKYIKPKLRAMLSFSGITEVNINGKEHMIKERIPKAIKILSQLKKKHKNKKMLISGSFLFNKNYNDIDVFVFSKYSKEDYKKEKIHVNYLPESAINSLFFSSISKISISNFRYTPKSNFTIKLENVIQNYEILIDFILRKKQYTQELRKFFLETEFISKDVILNPKQLYQLKKKAKHKNIISLLSDTLINSLLYAFTRMKIKNNLKKYIDDYSELLKQYKHAKNIEVYIKTYKEVLEVAA